MSTLTALETVGATSTATWTQRLADTAVSWLSRRTSRRGFLVRSAVVGSALSVDTLGFALKPQSAYASVCGPGASCGSGWTAFCATINKGVNACPPGSVAAGWWKADGASLCGGRARYIVDCNATCSRCATAGRPGICAHQCWSCSCHCGPGGQCDQRKVCCNGFRYGQCNQQVRQVGAVVCRVVSCVPPWTFENCTTASATDNNTRDHSSPALPGAWTPITARYWQLGELGSELGPTVYAEFDVPGGRAQRYLHGRISYKPAIGPRWTAGPVGHRYAELGNEAGVLGFPVADPKVIANARASVFERGRISWHPALGAFEVLGPVAAAYDRLGGELGMLKFPTASPRATADGTGRYSTFQLGRISWRPSVGAFGIGRAVAQRYVALGAEDGRLGYPTADEVGVTDAVRSAVFQHGRIVFTAATGAVEVYDDADPVYVRSGAEKGPLGAPLASAADGVQVFSTGRISNGFFLYGPVTDRYVALGAEGGSLGLPVGDEHALPDGRLQADFEHGSLVLDPSTGQVTSS